MVVLIIAYNSGTPNFPDSWLLYLFSSVFQGLSALLGILLASFAFFMDSIKHILKKMLPRPFPLKPIMVVVEIGLAIMASLFGLWLTPFLVMYSGRIQLTLASAVVILSVVALLDLMTFIYDTITLDLSNKS